MKRLFLVRHAKSDWSDPLLTDHKRTLNARGKRDASFMAEKFSERFGCVDLIVSSDAVRALTTAQVFSEKLKLSKKQFVIQPKIYEASLMQLIEIVEEMDNSANVAMLFGHNPGFSQIAEYLTHHHVEMPTCAIVELECAVDDWAQLSEGNCILKSFDFPKRYV